VRGNLSAQGLDRAFGDVLNAWSELNQREFGTWGGSSYIEQLSADPPAVGARLRMLLPEDDVQPDAVVED
jgi:hypothetical protein